MGSLRSFSPPCHTPFVRGIHRARWGRVRGRNAHLGALRAFDPPCHTPFVRGIHRARWGRVRGRNAHAERAERWPLWGVRALCSFALRHFAPAPKKSGFYFSLPHNFATMKRGGVRARFLRAKFIVSENVTPPRFIVSL